MNYAPHHPSPFGTNHAVDFESLSSYAAQPSNLNAVLSSYTANYAELFSAAQPASAAAAAVPSSMGPPCRPRKPKAPTLRDEDWEPYKERILQLHITEGLSLPEVRDRIEKEYGFRPEVRQYRSRISKWGKDKNVKSQEMAAIVRKRQWRKLVEPDKGQLAFKVRDIPVNTQKIERWIKKNKVMESAPYAPSPAASTPSDVGCYTISERGTPAMVSAHSPASMLWSPGGVNATARSSRIPSPALSTVSTIVQPPQNSFTGQSPTLPHQSLVIDLASLSTAPGEHIVLNANIRLPNMESEEKYLRESIFRAESSSSRTHGKTSDNLLRLGKVLLGQGRYKPAEGIARRALESHEGQNDGNEDNVDKLNALELLGRVYQSQGLYAKSEELLSRVVEGKEKELGPEHSATLTSMATLASVFARQGKYTESEALNRRTLEQRKKVLGSEHPYTLVSMNNLALVLSDQGMFEEAEELIEKILAEKKKVHGTNHPEMIKSVGNLALVLSRAGRESEAEALYRQSVARMTKVLGTEHPNTLLGTYNLANVLSNMGRTSEAEELDRITLAQREKVLGPQHPHTLDSVLHFAAVTAKQHKFEESALLYERALAGYTATLGETHPETVRCRKGFFNFAARRRGVRYKGGAFGYL